MGRRGLPKLSPEQTELTRRLDDTARSLVRAWLLRSLDRNPAPSAEELAERLGERGARLLRTVVGHAEAIVLEAVLAPVQVRRVRSGARLTAAKPMSGRYGMLPSPTFDHPPQTAAEFDWRVRSLAGSLKDRHDRASMLFRIITTPERVSLGLAADQLATTRQLDDLARAVCSGWLLRGLADTPPNDGEPPTADLADRFLERGTSLRQRRGPLRGDGP